jgi:hypothetical protein
MANTISRNFNFNGINHVAFSAVGTIHFIQSEEESLLVEGSEEALEHVKISQEADTLQVRLYTWYDFLFIPRPAVYTIRVKDLASFSISGSAEMDCESLNVGEHPLKISTSGSGRIRINALKCGSLHVSSSGSGYCDLKSVETQDLSASISGSGNYQLAGSAVGTQYSISGSGEIKTADLTSKSTNIHISGAGKITTRVSDQLDVHISGSGEVIYFGEPKINQSISGSGKVHRG